MPGIMIEKENKKVFSFLLCLLFGFVVYYLREYTSGLIGALVCYVLLRRQRSFLLQKKKWSKMLTSVLLLLEVLFVFILPFSFLVRATTELFMSNSFDITLLLQGYNRWASGIENFLGFDLFTIENLSFLPYLGASIVQESLAQTYWFALNLAVLLFVFYYLVYDGDRVERFVVEMLPLPPTEKSAFVHKVAECAFIYPLGISIIFVVVGWVSYIGYLFFDLSIPTFYASITAVGTFVPFVGGLAIGLMIVLVLFFIGEPGSAWGMLAFHVVVLLGIEIFLRRWLQKSYTHTSFHLLATPIGVFVGLGLWGLWGILLGPLFVSVFWQWIQIYRKLAQAKSSIEV